MATVFTLKCAHREKEYRFRASICYDICYPEVFAGENVDFWVQSANEAIDRLDRYVPVLLTMARFRAIECRRSLVRSVHGGYSALIDSNGRFVALIRDRKGGDETLVVEVPIDNRYSPYAHSREWLGLATSVIFACGVLFPRRRRYLEDVQ